MIIVRTHINTCLFFYSWDIQFQFIQRCVKHFKIFCNTVKLVYNDTVYNDKPAYNGNSFNLGWILTEFVS